MAAGLRCGSTTIKYLLFFFNFLFTLCGLAIVILGALGLTALNKADGTLNNSLIFIVIIGAFIFVVAFFGCCGAVRESNCMLVTFACLLMTIVVCEVIAAIIIFVAVGSIEETVDQIFEKAKNGDKELLEIVNAVQEGLQCCGLKDPSFWGSSPPRSCYSPNDQSKLYSRGCSALFSNTIRDFGKSIGAVAIAIAVIEVLGVWFALALAGEIKHLSRQ